MLNRTGFTAAMLFLSQLLKKQIHVTILSFSALSYNMKTLLTALCFFLVVVSYGQGEQNHWFFATNLALDFGTQPPTTSDNGHLMTDEGSAVISDQSGNLLFSTNGASIFDRNGDLMPNGTGLSGNYSSTQCAVIVPKPGDQNERFYYVFTISSQLEEATNPGLDYALIDMTLNNGLGDVAMHYDVVVDDVYEKIHATLHANGTEVWILTHKVGSNELYAVPVTCEGVGEPVVSASGSYVTSAENNRAAIGQLKASPDGTKIAMTWSDFPSLAAQLQLFDFDNETGMAQVNFQANVPNVEFSSGYGVEFSPSSRYLYWSHSVYQSTIERFDMDADDPTASRTTIANAGIQTFAALQLGPDGAIYVARSNGAAYLSSIEVPDAVSPSDVSFIDQAISLPGNSALGLPNTWTMKKEVSPQDTGLEREICAGTRTVLDASEWNGNAYLWSTGQTTPSIEVSQAGEYPVNIYGVCHTLTQTFEVSLLPAPEFTVPHTFSICDGETAQVNLLTDDAVLWSDGETGSIRTIGAGGPFGFTVTRGDCSEAGVLHVQNTPLPVIKLPTFEFSICEGNSVVVSPVFEHADSLSWSDGSTKDFIRIDKESSIWVKAVNDCGSVEKQINVIEEECHCPLFLPNAFTPNQDGINDLFKATTPCHLKEFELIIFNRWGAEVFYTTDISQGWPGGEDYYAPNTFYQYRYTATLEKNGDIFYREGKGHVQSMR